jgi:glucose 1-dehydrogenase
MDLNGKVAIVTGAGSGIGHATAERFASAGAAVCVNYLGYEDDAKALAARLPCAIAVRADVSKADQVHELVGRTCRELGGVDVLVNNAGIEKEMAFLDLDEQTWDTTIAVNLKGPFLCSQACARAMRDAGRGGSIVNISSIHEDVTFPGFTPYCAAKGGLRMLMRNTAVELAPHGIRVNNIAPGAIVTPLNQATLDDPAKLQALHEIIPLRRMGQASEVAEVALFLASAASSYVTGSTYYVDGGMVRYSQPL